ncbi:hypothetical protein D1815_17440 [Aquimarina sp. AD1]|uniref:lanthionine synthetase LanC family protein n=1 Tax=Aquimarina sp. (strain AD1) TaxID=1714848 RepID=UPI000E524B07|nr:lanthionine synthetase LanC family protein [Aquimarina sp. AD1]AXT57443.1 hypothetical protein D1815_17440 [Aquimarina sp. AD1]RKN02905.1 hypothetical protein D7035_22715 [Aquimarina sp. AD1]
MAKSLYHIEEFVWRGVQKEERIGLLNGLSGILLFYQELLESQTFIEKNDLEDKMTYIITKINNIISQKDVLPTMCSGLTGYGIALLRCNKIVNITEEYFQDIETILVNALKIEEKNDNYDLLHGAIGISLYFAEKYSLTKNRKAYVFLDQYFNTLLTKINNNLNNVIEMREWDGSKAYYFGLAHGVSGILSHIVFLSNLLQIKNQKVYDAISALLEFLNQYKGKEIHKYPNFHNIDQLRTVKSRLAWCQGDIGIGYTMINCGNLLNDTKIIEEGILILEDTFKIPFNQTGIKDFGICHGSSGIFLQYFLYIRDRNLSNDKILNFWIDKIEEQTENYQTFKAFEGKNYIEEINVLEGASGLGLILLALSNKTDLSWVKYLNLC